MVTKERTRLTHVGHTGTSSKVAVLSCSELDRELYGFDDWAVSEKTAPERIIGFGGVFVSHFNGRQTNNLGYRFEPESWGKVMQLNFPVEL